MEVFNENPNLIEVKGNKKRITLLAVIIVSTAVFLTWQFFFKNKCCNSPEDIIIENLVEEKNYFKDVSLEAKSAFVWDVQENKVLFSQNEETQLPLASLTKLMTALISSELVPEGTIITISEDDINIEGDNGLKEGERWTLANVLDFTLMASSNDGAHALASVIGFIKTKEEGKTETDMFIDEMNERAEKIGLTQTYFLSESGLDLNEVMGGAYGSARDMAFLMGYIVETDPKLLEATKYSTLEIQSKNYIHSVENTNQEVETIPGIIGSKTGFTDLAGGNLVIAFNIGIGHPIVVSVLGSSKEGRFEDIKKLVSASIEQIASN